MNMKTSLIILVAFFVVASAPMSGEETTQSYMAEYFLLGMLNEYCGSTGRVVGTDLVEYFYSGEKEFTDSFEYYLNELASYRDIKPAERIDWGNGSTEFQSKKLAEILNSFYPTPDDCARDQGYLSFWALEWDEQVMRSYLAGAKTRYYRNGKFKFANNIRKAQLIRSILLVFFQCESVSISMTGTIPSTVTLEFSCGGQLEDIFSNTD